METGMKVEAALETWRLRALQSAPGLCLALEEVNTSAAILANALGSDVVKRLSSRVDKSIALPIRRHPIGRAITTPGPESVITIAELAPAILT